MRPRAVEEDATTLLRPAGRSRRGETFGPYTVLERIGSGGMATVHRALRRGEYVALKRLLPNVANDPELVDLFLHEARLVATLRHRNIAAIYEAGEVEDEYFLAMELVTGPTLKQLLQRCAGTVGLVPYPIVVALLVQVCDALAYAHDHCDCNGKPVGLVHRDITPSNIVIGNDGIVKLIDFGIAKTASTHTRTGIVKGKLGYIAPEYLEGAIDRRADLWAVGVVAWEMLTHRRLFAADDDLTTLQNVRNQPIEPPSTYNPDVPPELDSIVMTALTRDADHRWQNASALRTALVSVALPSTRSELVEWIEWVFKLSERGLRPVRGSRPLVPMNAIKLVLGSGGHAAQDPAIPAAEPVAATVAPKSALERAKQKRSATPTAIGAGLLARQQVRSARSRVALVLALIAVACAAAFVAAAGMAA